MNTIKEFIDFYNYECIDRKAELEPDVLEALRDQVKQLIVLHVDEIDDIADVPEFEFISKSGQIKLKEDIDKETKVD